ncbi:MAG: YggS family pyridoxal phosphate-dependent enzyme [Elusimicrobia bacterium]|nr:YggS family pyridoxal phosphate-dependent enzyme [Candidatus Liberimonas magnetica]
MINQNIDFVRKKIAVSCKKANKNHNDITIVAVTKTVPIELINETITAGIKDIGESKLQEALLKIDKLPANIKKHFIGHLQSNKAKKVVEFFDLIQSVDSLGLLEEIDKHAFKAGKVQECLFELKVSDETTKFGITKENLGLVLKNIEKLNNIKLCGLMAMAPYFEDPNDAKPYFKQAKEVFDNIKNHKGLDGFNILSMGMSHDFEAAIEEGSNMVRIGTAIFGERAIQNAK